MNAIARIEEMESALTPLGAEMVGALGVEAQVAFGELTLVAGRERILEVLTVLRDRFGLSNIDAADVWARIEATTQPV